MAVSPEGTLAPPVETPPHPPEAHTLEPGSDSGAGRLSFCTKVCYGIGGVPNQVASSAIAFYLQLFLLDVAQIPAAQVSLVLFGGKVSGAAADPLAGFFINRSRRTGSGRLMPWPWQRCKETALPGQVAVSPNATRLYSIAATVVAVTYPVCSSLLCLGVKERPDASARASGQGLSFLAGLRLTVRHPPYLKLVISFLFISAAVQVEQSYLVLFCAHASRLHDHVQSLVLTILVSAVLSTPMWEWVLQRFGKRMSAFGIFGMVPFAILLAAMPTAPVAYVVAFVSGVSIAVSLLLPWSMLPDVVDEFQLQHQHGPGLETIFYSSYVFFTKLSGGPATASLEFETPVSWNGRSSIFWAPSPPSQPFGTPASQFTHDPSFPLGYGIFGDSPEGSGLGSRTPACHVLPVDCRTSQIGLCP
ncbi:sphingosine-1-phosphate transporter MFSD2B isoform X8 [Sagmatias obliquidens]|uniref:sphingosine-1-phosphate transporter MFSD2B isoform X8 n=1 Tax=Sagmatias obliquidens TaxID=3371155 RepID=UPI000F43F7CD|nr:major facilitator superfamily domain-containing protein 2B isoform X8 [Lagenorhynchus obliquidens]